MIGCPRCESPAGVQIAGELGHAADQGSGGSSIRWALHCDECGADWSIVDEIRPSPSGGTSSRATDDQTPRA